MTAGEARALAGLGSALDQATILERRLARRGESIGDAVAALLRGTRHHALGHALLAALPVREVIRTNYDELFETAWSAPGSV